jgi:hypothetical protein
MTDLNNKLPVIDTDAEMAEFRNVWETFLGDNDHFGLKAINHQSESAGRENELYKLVLDLDLKDLPDVARERVLTMATQIMNAQEQAPTSYKPVSLEGFRDFPFYPSPQPVIDDDTISLVTSFFPTSRYSTEQHLGNVSNVMTLLENAINNQQ